MKRNIKRRLSVNLDHIATLRQVRKINYPDLMLAAGITELGGADGITLHLRGDRRHIQDDDVKKIKVNSILPVTLEMAATEEMLSFAAENRIHTVTLVPERPSELTTEGGLDIAKNISNLTHYIKLLKGHGIKVTAFTEPDSEQIHASFEAGCDAVEMHTGRYALVYPEGIQAYKNELERIEKAASLGVSKGLLMNCGHGLHYQNVLPLAAIHDISEFSIGHGIVSRAVFTGLEKAVREMADLILWNF
jgi:pyridoxine 5-phosphate synthase